MKSLLTSVFILLYCIIAMGQDKKYTIVFLNKKPDAEKISKEESAKLMEGHMANINKLAKEGKLLAAGPFEGGGGIFILNTTSTDEANAWIGTDPGIQAKRWNVELLPYTPRIGSVCTLSEPYEMVNYTLIRFDAIVSKFTAATYPQILKKHDDYVTQLAKTGNVISYAIFGDTAGGVLVMRGDVTREVFESDPGVQEALIELDIRKLFIAKGAFCEGK
jgi:uncharacterized protein YciI